MVDRPFLELYFPAEQSIPLAALTMWSCLVLPGITQVFLQCRRKWGYWTPQLGAGRTEMSPGWPLGMCSPPHKLSRTLLQTRVCKWSCILRHLELVDFVMDLKYQHATDLFTPTFHVFAMQLTDYAILLSWDQLCFPNDYAFPNPSSSTLCLIVLQ